MPVVHAANGAMKIAGSYGFSTEYPIERYYPCSIAIFCILGVHQQESVLKI